MVHIGTHTGGGSEGLRRPSGSTPRVVAATATWPSRGRRASAVVVSSISTVFAAP